MSELIWLSARELLAGYRAREFTPSEVLAAVTSRIEDREAAYLNAFTTLSLEVAERQARRADAAWRRAERALPLEGIPIAVKDLFDTAGVRTTYGSPMFAENVPGIDAAVVARAKAAGALLLGKTATHEFGWGITTNSAHFGPTRNPWASDLTPGGSSGGSAVALATGMTPLAIGSDTGGSIRIPAAFCGVSGLKPTWGRISAAGAISLARTLDHPGPMARDPADLALLYGVLAGVDIDDPATEDVPVDLSFDVDVAGLRIGVAGSVPGVELSAEVITVFAAATDTVRALGADVTEVALPDPVATYDCFVTTQRAEAASYHAARGLYPSRALEYGEDVRGRLELASKVTLAEYVAAQTTRQSIRAAWARLFSSIDVLLTPVAAITAPPIGHEEVEHAGAVRDVRELVMSYTVAQDLVGLPACAVRGGFDAHGLPVGVQFTGSWWSESRVLGCAERFHAATPEAVRRRRP